MSSNIYANVNNGAPPLPPKTYRKDYVPESVYGDINKATIYTRYHPVPSPRGRGDIILNTSLTEGGRRLRKTTRRHRKTKNCRRLNKKKSKKSKKRT
jgi:hypothetical protein